MTIGYVEPLYSQVNPAQVRIAITLLLTYLLRPVTGVTEYDSEYYFNCLSLFVQL